MDAINPILDHVEAFRNEDLPPHVIELTKRFILDTLAVTLAGRNAPGCKPLIDHFVEMGGKAEASALGVGRMPAPNAAFVNGLMAHALDYDDTHEPAELHAFCVVLSAVLACAESIERCTGKEIIVATAIGTDIAYRMANAIEHLRGWHPTATCGIFGATVAAARILGLDRAEMHNAAGIAYSLASGNFQCMVDKSLTKRMQAAFAARSAVEAVFLARRGVSGAKDILEGKFGFYPLYEANQYDRSALVDGLGQRFEVEGTSMKPYPSCRSCHGGIDAALDLIRHTGLTADNLKSIKIVMPPEVHDFVGGRYDPGDTPQVSAQFSIAYNVATALRFGRVGPNEISVEAATDEDTIALTRRIELATNNSRDSYAPVSVTVVTQLGETMERSVDILKGHPDNPMTDAERLEKLRSCVAYADLPGVMADDLATWAASLDADALLPIPSLMEILPGSVGK